MSVREAGRKDGHKGGEMHKERLGPEGFPTSGTRAGGQHVREPIEEGKQSEGNKGATAHSVAGWCRSAPA